MQWTLDQQAAIETVGMRLCVDAGAGSGKTRVLVERILHLIERRHADLDRIVAITFTENAAAEMKERLRRECRRRAPRDDAQQMSFWRDVERRVESARISTIHGFCSRLLRENALHLGLDPEFTVLAEAESHLLRTRAVTEGLHELLEQQNPAAVRVAAEYGLRQTRNVLRQFLNRTDLLDRVAQDFALDDPDALRKTWATVLDKYERERRMSLTRSLELRRFLRDLAAFEGKCHNPSDPREVLRIELMLQLERILSGTDAGTIGKCLEAIAQSGSTRASRKNWDADAFDAIADLQKKVRDFARKQLPKEPVEEIEARAAGLTCDFHATFRHIAAVYERMKRDGTAVDFDDLIHRALNLLETDEAIRRRTAQGIRFLLIDEFQDTDTAQYRMARLLTDIPDGPELFIVGDARQSIYYFRGADVDVFRGARKDSQRVIPLARNFRSLPEVIHFVNDTFARTGLLGAVEEKHEGMEPHRDPCHECRVEFLLPDGGEGGERKADHRAREAELIAARLAQMCGPNGVQVCDKDTGAPRPAQYGDVAILFRSLSNVYMYEQRLKQWRIPYTLMAGRGFYQRPEIVDLKNLLTLLGDPWDEVALFGFLRSPLVGLSDEALLELRGWGEDRRGIAHAFNAGFVPEDETTAELLRAARDLVNDLRLHLDMPLAEFLRRTLDRTGYEAMLLADPYLGTQKASNVRKLLDLALDFSRTRPPRLGAFLRYLEDAASQEVREGEAALAAEGSGAVTLMTIHKAKGLEFPIVVVPDLGRCPGGASTGPVAIENGLGLAGKVMGDDGTLQAPLLYDAISELQKRRETAEEARLLYVALTRSRDWLLLACGTDGKGINASWFQALDDAYGLMGRKDGETFGGEGWQAVVRRTVDAKPADLVEETGDARYAREEIERRVQPVSPGPSRRRSRSVSAVLDRLAVDAAPTNGRTQGARPATPVDPRMRGTLLHLLFQRWDLRSSARAAAETVCREECPTIAGRARLIDELAAVAERFQSTDLGRRIAAQSAIQREAPFVLRVGNVLVKGSVDAVLDDGTIVDYKTGRPDARSHARYEQQVLLYAAAVRDLCGVLPPAAYLAYVDTGEAVAVDVSTERIDAAVERARRALEQPAPLG